MSGEYVFLCDEHLEECRKEGKFIARGHPALQHCFPDGIGCDADGCEQKPISFVLIDSSYFLEVPE